MSTDPTSNVNAEDFDVRIAARLAAIQAAGWCVNPTDPDLIDWQYARLVEAQAGAS